MHTYVQKVLIMVASTLDARYIQPAVEALYNKTKGCSFCTTTLSQFNLSALKRNLSGHLNLLMIFQEPKQQHLSIET